MDPFFEYEFVKNPPITDYLPKGSFVVKGNVLVLWLPEKVLYDKIVVDGQLLYSPEGKSALIDDCLRFAPLSTPMTQYDPSEGYFVYTVDDVVVELRPPHLPPEELRHLKPFYANVLPLLTYYVHTYVASHNALPDFSNLLSAMMSVIPVEVHVLRNYYLPLHLAILVASGVLAVI